MDSFPIEVLENIFKFSENNLKNLQVCRSWFYAFLKFVYLNMLNKEYLPPFLNIETLKCLVDETTFLKNQNMKCQFIVYVYDYDIIKNFRSNNQIYKIINLCIDDKKIKDVTCFSTAKILRLGNCKNLLDVSPLKNAEELYLKGCSIIQNISSLGQVKKIHLYACFGIKNISGLSGVKILKLSWCKGIEDFTPLADTQIEDLDLTGCKIKDVSPLKKIHTINLSRCPELEDASPLVTLGKVQNLNLD